MRDVPVGPGSDNYLRTIEVLSGGAGGALAGSGATAAGAPAAAGGAAAAAARVPVVLLPGYGAGACFFWRCGRLALNIAPALLIFLFFQLYRSCFTVCCILGLSNLYPWTLKLD